MVISGRKPLLVLVMYWPSTFRRGDSDWTWLSVSILLTSFSRRSWAHERAGQSRIACLNVSWSVPHLRQVSAGFSSTQEGWAAR